MKINLHIERLVLDGVGFEPSGRRQLQAAVEFELSRLLAEGGLNAEMMSGGTTPALRAEAIELAGNRQDEPVDALGARIAQSVYGEIGGNFSNEW